MNMAVDDANFHGAKLALFGGDQLAIILRDDDPDMVSPIIGISRVVAAKGMRGGCGD